MQLRAEHALNRYQRRCGCGAGAVCFLAVLAAGGFFVTSTAEGITLAVLGRALAWVAAAFGLGLATKIAVLALTRLQFAAACRRQWGELSAMGRAAEVHEGRES